MKDASPHLPLRADQRPLYVQASEALKTLMQRGDYAPGDRLPSEIVLSQQLGISRPTLREALHKLEEAGTIIRRHGVGTFVAESEPVIEDGLELLESIDRIAKRYGLSTEMAEATVTERLATTRELLGLERTDPTSVTVAMRVIVADGRRIAFLTDVVPQEYLRGADLGDSFHGSVLDIFLDRADLPLAHSRTELVAEVADRALARRLQVQPGAPLLRLEAQLYAQDGQVVDHSISYFVPGHFKFHVIRRIA